MGRPRFLALAAIIGLAPCAGAASVLTFDHSTPVIDNSVINQDYGDRITSTSMPGGFTYGVGSEGATPNVLVAYSTSAGLPVVRSAGFGDLTNVLNTGSNNISSLEIHLTADPGYLVRWHSFEAALSGPSPGLNAEILNAAGNELVTSTNFGPETVGHSDFDTGEFALIADTGLRIIFEFPNTEFSGLLGIDNVVFSQMADPAPIPLPASLPLFVFALLAFSRFLIRRS